MKQEQKKQNFLYFPNKLNNIALVLIICAYIIVLGFIFYISYSGTNYKITIDYDHTLYNSEIDNMVAVNAAVKPDTDDDGNTTLKTTFSIYLRCYSLISTQLQNVSYEVNAESVDDTMYYLYQTANSTKTTTNVNHQITSGKTISGDALKEIYVKTWHNTALQGSGVSRTVSTVEEDIITLDLAKQKSLFKTFDDDTNANAVMDGDTKKVSVEYVKTTQKGQAYIATTTMKVLYGSTVTGARHTDVQSYLVLKDGTAYPYMGWYNLQYKGNLTSPLVGYIYDIDAVAIYTIVKFYDESGFSGSCYYKYDL